MSFPRPATAALAATAILATGCGDAQDKPATPQRDPDANRQLLRAAALSLRNARSFHFEGTQTNATGPTRFIADVHANGDTDVTLETPTGTVRLRRIGTAGYTKADRAYILKGGGSRGPELARRFAGRWVVGTAATASERNVFDDLAPRRLAECLQNHDFSGTLTTGARSATDDPDVRILHSVGDQPGSTPGDLYLPTTGAPRPLRATQTGPSRPGGPVSTCTGDPGITAADFRFSRYDRAAAIRRPKNTVRPLSNTTTPDSTT